MPPDAIVVPSLDAFLFHDCLGAAVRSLCPTPVHPNFITAVGFVATLALLPAHAAGAWGLVLLLLFARTACDCLDGEVARACDKRTRLGGYLDTLSDTVFGAIMAYIFATFFTRSRTLRIAAPAAALLLFFGGCYALDSTGAFLHDHESIRDDVTSPLRRAFSAACSNTIVVVLIVAVTYLGLTGFNGLWK
jgi:phosphatidylglycerophosphate synthase